MSDNNEDWGMTIPPRKLDDKAAETIRDDAPKPAAPVQPDDWAMTQAIVRLPDSAAPPPAPADDWSAPAANAPRPPVSDFDKTTPNIDLPPSPDPSRERDAGWHMPKPVFRVSAGETPNFDRIDEEGRHHDDENHPGGHTVPYYRLQENQVPEPESGRAAQDSAPDPDPPKQQAPSPASGSSAMKWVLALVGLFAFFVIVGGALVGVYFVWFSGSGSVSMSPANLSKPAANTQPAAAPVPASTPEAKAPSATISYKGEMVLVAGGEFTMGSDSGAEEAKPAHKVKLAAFYIDKYEVTNAQYKEFCDATKRPYPASQYWDEDYFASRPNAPVLGVSFDDARAYAEWAGKRLPTEAEWEMAAAWSAASGSKFEFPWGNTFEASKAAFSSEQPSDVGRFAGGASPSGALDMAGNAAEWVDSYFSAYPGNQSSNPNFGETNRVVRGGHFASKSNDSLRTTKRIYVLPGFVPEGDKASYIGFRCAVSADDPRIAKSADR